MRTTSIMALLGVSLGAAPALADIPPPSTYVETCTIAKQLTATSECLECGAYHGDTTRCSKLLGPYCYQSLCKTWGASSWSEVLCRLKSDAAPVVPSDVVAMLKPATTAPTPDGGTAGVNCAPFMLPSTDTKTTTITQTSTDTKSGTATPTETKSGTVTQSATESKTTTATQTPTETKSGTVTQSATESKTTTATQAPTETKSSTASETGIQTTEVTQTTTAIQTVTATQSATAVTSTGTQTSTATSPSKSSDDSSGCSVTTGKSAVRALGPLSVIVAGLALLALGRRRRR